MSFSRTRSTLAAVAILGTLYVANMSVGYWGGWISSAFRATPAQKCADPKIVDQLASAIREAAVVSERLFSDKPSSSAGSNGSYAPPATSSEPRISVVVMGTLAIDYNAKIDRTSCQLSFRIDGAERTNVIALLEGKGPDRTLPYFVQPDENNRPVVSR